MLGLRVYLRSELFKKFTKYKIVRASTAKAKIGKTLCKKIKITESNRNSPV